MSVLGEALVPCGLGVLHGLLLAPNAQLAHAAPQREVRRVCELPRLVRLWRGACVASSVQKLCQYTTTHHSLACTLTSTVMMLFV